MIYGDSDPWYFMRLPDTDNQNIHIFVSSKESHGVNINNMEEELSTEIKALLSEWLMQDAFNLSGGGCNSYSYSFSCMLILVLGIILFKRKGFYK